MWDTTEPDNSIDSLLSSTLGAQPESNYDSGISAATGVIKTDYAKLYAFRNVISYSMEGVLDACPREFQIAKLESNSSEGRPRTNNVTFAFGHAVGAGVAVYDKTQDLKQAIFAAFLAWDIDLLAEDRGKSAQYDPKKSFAFAIYALQKYATWYEEYGLGAYEVVDLEATVVVDLQTGDAESGQPTQFHTGHADELLRHKVSRKLRVKENKTTAMRSVDPAMYANSNQTIGYSIIVSQFGDTDYEVLYTVYSSTEQRWLEFEFHKSALTQVEWLKAETLQADQIQVYAESDFFPKRGSSCIRYGRQCQHFGTCDMNLAKQFGERFADLPVATLDALNQIEPFKYHTTKAEVVQSLRRQLAGQQKATTGATDES